MISLSIVNLILIALASGGIAIVSMLISNRINYARQQRKDRREYLIRLYDKVVLLCRVDHFEDSPVLLNKMVDVTYSNILELSLTFETINLFDFFNIKNEMKVLDRIKDTLNQLKIRMAKTDLSSSELHLEQEFKSASKVKEELDGLKQAIFKKVNKEVKKI